MKESYLVQRLRLPHKGGVGLILRGRKWFCVKIVSLLRDGKLNDSFWQEARSVSMYHKTIRSIPFCLDCPLPVQYWIHQSDPLYRNYPRENISLERPKCLADYLSVFDIIPGEYFPNTEEYWSIPEKLLHQIYQDNLCADVVLTFPVPARGSRSLGDFIKKHQTLVAEDAERLLGQMLTAILALYDNGCAHCDIKPSNILVASKYMTHVFGGTGRDGERQFFLTDFGSVNIEGFSSDSGTASFFNHHAYRQWTKAGISNLECRTLMDAYALGLTLFSVAVGHIPYSLNVSTDPIEKLWPGKITDACKVLLDVYDLSIDKLKSLQKQFPENYVNASVESGVTTYGKEAEIQFEVCLDTGKEMQFGKLHEQLSFSNKLAPVMKIIHPKQQTPNFKSLSWEAYQNHTEMPTDSLLYPIISCFTNGGMKDSVVFYAPDDARTLKRAETYDGYIPCSLVNTIPKGQELEQLLHLGDILTKAHIRALPTAENVIRVNGKWYVLWQTVQGIDMRGINVREYFKYLCKQPSSLSIEEIESIRKAEKAIATNNTFNDMVIRKLKQQVK